MLELVQSDLVTMLGLSEILSYARQHFRLGLATGSSTPFMTEVLRRLEYFRSSMCCRVPMSWPMGSRILRSTCEPQSGLAWSPSRALVLEDSSNGVRAAGRRAAMLSPP